MRKIVFILSGIFLMGTAMGQVSVFDCQALPETVTQSMISSSPQFYRPCVTLGGGQNIDMSGPTKYKVTATNEIKLKDGVYAGAFTNEGEAHFKIEAPARDFDVAVMNYGDLQNVQKLLRFELGIKFSNELQTKIDNFTEKANVPASQKLNPYLEWETRVVAIFQKEGSNETIEIDGFYYKDYEVWQQDTLPVPNNWQIGYSEAEYRGLGGWTHRPSPYMFRVRFAPPQAGRWKGVVKVITNETMVAYESPEFYFNVQDNNNEGYVYAGRRFMLRNGKTFFPVGINLPWPETHENFDPDLSAMLETTDTWSNPGDTIRYRITEGYTHYYVAPRVYDSYRKVMTQLADGGANYMRMIMNPISNDIEYEELGNYTKRLPQAYELDKILEHAEQKGLFIHWNMTVHYTYQMLGETSYWRYWTWNDTVDGKPFCYAGLVGPDPVDFLTHAEAKKYYKQRLRYILARWGYSENIAVWELFSEISNLGSEAPDKSYFYQRGSNWRMYRDWQVEMAGYLKSQYHGRIHAVTSSYTDAKVPEDDTFDDPNFDLMTVNRYDFKDPSFVEYTIQTTSESILNNMHVDGYTKRHIKPIMFSETDAVDAICDEDRLEIIRAQWQRLFSGLAGSLSWMMWYKPEQFPILGQMRQAIEGIELEGENWHPGTCDLIESTRGTEWVFNRDYVDGMDGKIFHPFEFKKKPRMADLIYLRSGDKNFAIGVVSNKTYNIHNQGNSCFKYWWENTCTNCIGEYKKPEKLDITAYINTRDGKLKLMGMHGNRYYVNYFRPDDQYIPKSSSDNVGPNVKMDAYLYPSPEEYIQVVKARRKDHSWLMAKTIIDDRLNVEELSMIDQAEILDKEELKTWEVELQVYPNPFEDKIIIKHPYSGKIEVELFNMDGKSIKLYYISESETILNIPNLAEGIYYLQFRAEKQIINQIKLKKL